MDKDELVKELEAKINNLEQPGAKTDLALAASEILTLQKGQKSIFA